MRTSGESPTTCGRSRIQSVERADASIGDGDDEPLQLQPMTDTRGEGAGAGWTSDRCQDGERQQSSAVEEFFRTLHADAHFLREPALPPPFFFCEEEPAPDDSPLLLLPDDPAPLEPVDLALVPELLEPPRLRAV